MLNLEVKRQGVGARVFHLIYARCKAISSDLSKLSSPHVGNWVTVE